MFTYTVLIENPHTGERREWHSEWEPWEQDPSGREGLHFMFYDGNYSCNCNRALFWAEAGKEEDPDVSCSDAPRWRVKVVIDSDAFVVLDDFAGVS